MAVSAMKWQSIGWRIFTLGRKRYPPWNSEDGLESAVDRAARRVSECRCFSVGGRTAIVRWCGRETRKTQSSSSIKSRMPKAARSHSPRRESRPSLQRFTRPFGRPIRVAARTRIRHPVDEWREPIARVDVTGSCRQAQPGATKRRFAGVRNPQPVTRSQRAAPAGKCHASCPPEGNEDSPFWSRAVTRRFEAKLRYRAGRGWNTGSSSFHGVRQGSRFS